jgi:tight adherence protein C
VVFALTVLLFLTTIALGLGLGVKYWIRPKAAIDRLRQTSEPVSLNHRPLKSKIRSVLDAAGHRMGSRDKDRERVLQQLARAGFRKPSALNLYNGSRGLGSLVLAITLAGLCLGTQADSSTMIMAAVGGVLAGFSLPGEFLRIKARQRRRSIERAMPNMLDMLTICVESGLGLDQAILHVSRELGRAHQELSEELSMINFETRAGKSRPEALRNLAARTGVPDIKELTAVLIQADRFGTSVAQTLRAYSNHLRVQARQRAEEKAAQLSVKLVFPIFFFILPSLFVITVGPVVVRIVRDLLPMMNSL